MFRIVYFTIFTVLFFMSVNLYPRGSVSDVLGMQKEMSSFLQFETGRKNSGHTIYYDDAENCFYACDVKGNWYTFSLSDEGYDIAGHGLYQNWFHLSAARDITGDTFVKIETGSVIDRWMLDENKACWGVREAYLTFDGKRFVLADIMSYISYVDKQENSWVQDIFVNNEPEKTLLLHEKYTADKTLIYEMLK